MKEKKTHYNSPYNTEGKSKLVMYDSDRHTFDEALRSIWLVTGFEEIQCEQLTLLIHLKGQTVIRIGEMGDLIPMMEVLIEEGYQVHIQ